MTQYPQENRVRHHSTFKRVIFKVHTSSKASNNAPIIPFFQRLMVELMDELGIKIPDFDLIMACTGAIREEAARRRHVQCPFKVGARLSVLFRERA